MIQNYRNKLEQLKGEKKAYKQQIKSYKQEIHNSTILLRNCEKTREIIRIVGLSTQQQLQFHISDITSLALAGVFANPYQLKAEFIERRNKTECDLLFEKDDKIFDPLDSSGYGAVDVAAFALRIASWSMKIQKSNNTIITDEPFKFLDKSKHHLASKIINELSNKLNIQFIVITHEEALAQQANKIFYVKQDKKISYVKK